MNPIHVLVISGSLRAASSNTALLNAITAMLPAGVQFSQSIGLDHFPAFNPDHDQPGIVVSAVTQFREQISSAHAVLICTPEYAFGVPGALKNALDWTVSSGSLNEKPVAVITASPLYTGGSNAMASLLLTLKALGTVTDNTTSLCIPSINKIFSEDGKIKEENIAIQVTQLLQHLLATANANGHQG